MRGRLNTRSALYCDDQDSLIANGGFGHPCGFEVILNRAGVRLVLSNELAEWAAVGNEWSGVEWSGVESD